MTIPHGKRQIAIVGPCGVGKSTLAEGLQRRGYRARQIVQEHSYVPDMWQVIGRPDLLIFLDASFECCSRRKLLNWGESDYLQQQHRLAHARSNCDVYIATDTLEPAQVLAIAVRRLEAPAVAQASLT